MNNLLIWFLGTENNPHPFSRVLIRTCPLSILFVIFLVISTHSTNDCKNTKKSHYKPSEQTILQQELDKLIIEYEDTKKKLKDIQEKVDNTY